MKNLFAWLRTESQSSMTDLGASIAQKSFLSASAGEKSSPEEFTPIEVEQDER